MLKPDRALSPAQGHEKPPLVYCKALDTGSYNATPGAYERDESSGEGRTKGIRAIAGRGLDRRLKPELTELAVRIAPATILFNDSGSHLGSSASRCAGVQIGHGTPHSIFKYQMSDQQGRKLNLCTTRRNQ
jgi:hypothetical protein